MHLCIEVLGHNLVPVEHGGDDDEQLAHCEVPPDTHAWERREWVEHLLHGCCCIWVSLHVEPEIMFLCVHTHAGHSVEGECGHAEDGAWVEVAATNCHVTGGDTAQEAKCGGGGGGTCSHGCIG